MRRSFFSIAAILGPLWTGGALAFDNYYTLLGVPLGLLLITVVSQLDCMGLRTHAAAFHCVMVSHTPIGSSYII